MSHTSTGSSSQKCLHRKPRKPSTFLRRSNKIFRIRSRHPRTTKARHTDRDQMLPCCLLPCCMFMFSCGGGAVVSGCAYCTYHACVGNARRVLLAKSVTCRNRFDTCHKSWLIPLNPLALLYLCRFRDVFSCPGLLRVQAPARHLCLLALSLAREKSHVCGAVRWFTALGAFQVCPYSLPRCSVRGWLPNCLEPGRCACLSAYCVTQVQLGYAASAKYPGRGQRQQTSSSGN